MSSSSTGVLPPSSTTVSLKSAAAASETPATTSANKEPSAESASTQSTSEVVALRQQHRRPRGFFTRGDSALERFSAAVAKLKAAASVSDSFPRSTTSTSNDPQESLLVDDPEKDVCNGSHSATLSSGNTPNAIVESSKEESSDDITKKSDNDNPSNVQCQSSANMNQLDEATCNAQQPPLSLETASGATSQTTSNMLRVPSSGYGGAIPRRPFSRDSSAESTSSSIAADTTKTCFCGHYTEGPSGPSSKRGRCKFCRSRAKYVSGQRSFDASRLFGRRRERGEPRRAASEDQRKRDGGSTAEDNEKTIDERTSSAAVEAIASTSSLDFDITSSTSQRRTWRLKPSVRRQARLELDVPSAANSGATASVSGSGPSNSIAGSISPSGSRDHGLRTPPGPPTMPPCPGGSLPSTVTSSSSPSSLSHARQSFGVRRPTTLHHDPDSTVQNSQRYATHMMASDMSGLLAPPSRSGALYRAHTDPTSSNSNFECNQQKTPNSPPPTYEEVMKQPRVAPPSYEEALSTRMVTSLRLASQQHHSSALPGTSSGGPGGQIRSLSEDRATSHPSPPPPFRGRNSSGSNLRPLTRSSRVEEIPDIYWEQAARELDFCTCRKCQARYRQYFEEDLADSNNDAEAMIPMETQVLMQEVLTDGMAFCSLM